VGGRADGCRAGPDVVVRPGAASGGAERLLVFPDWVPTPLNRNIRQATVRDRLIRKVIYVPVGLLVLVAAHQRWVVLAGAIWLSVVLLVGIVNWWVHRQYAGNVTVLPWVTRSSVRPDLQHTPHPRRCVPAACVTCFVLFLTTP